LQISGERRFPMGENRIPDDIFKQAVEKAREIETSIFEKRFKDTDKHSFSEKYLERMQILKMRKSEENDAKIVNYSVKKKSTKVKILLIAAIVILLKITVPVDLSIGIDGTSPEQAKVIEEILRTHSSTYSSL